MEIGNVYGLQLSKLNKKETAAEHPGNQFHQLNK